MRFVVAGVALAARPHPTAGYDEGDFGSGD